MSLNYDWTHTPDHADLPESLRYTACMATMVVGVGDLSTNKGMAEYTLRLKAFEAWFGPLYYGPEADENREGLAAYADKVRGLKTNVSLEPRAKWFKRMTERYVSENAK